MSDVYFFFFSSLHQGQSNIQKLTSLAKQKRIALVTGSTWLRRQNWSCVMWKGYCDDVIVLECSANTGSSRLPLRLHALERKQYSRAKTKECAFVWLNRQKHKTTMELCFQNPNFHWQCCCRRRPVVCRINSPQRSGCPLSPPITRAVITHQSQSYHWPVICHREKWWMG